MNERAIKMNIGYSSSMMYNPMLQQPYGKMHTGAVSQNQAGPLGGQLKEKYNSLSPEQQQAVQQHRAQTQTQLQGAGISRADVQAAAQEGGMGAVKDLLAKAGIALPQRGQMQTQATGQMNAGFGGSGATPLVGGKLNYNC
jgi:hypothetical protein